MMMKWEKLKILEGDFRKEEDLAYKGKAKRVKGSKFREAEAESSIQMMKTSTSLRLNNKIKLYKVR